MALTLVTAPIVEPISLEEAKAHLRVDHTDDDAMIEIYIRAAREYVEGPYGFLGRALVTQTWRLTLDEFPDNEIKIPLPPLQSITNLYYDDPDGNEQIVSPTDYFVDTASEPGWIIPIASADWPTPIDAINSVRIDFVAGYAPDTGQSPIDYTANIPFNIKAALLLTMANLYEHREENATTSFSSLPMGVDMLLRQFKIHLSMQ
jgi:uncharacterized phiE125 gp8 family phage protein